MCTGNTVLTQQSFGKQGSQEMQAQHKISAPTAQYASASTA